MPDMDPERALVFGQLAEVYAESRPGYPEEAVDFLVRRGTRHVVDVGAGTGKLTGQLLARGLHVEAVEPDPDMLAALRRRFPAAVGHVAAADALPLRSASVDAVLAADAWHWFPFERTIAEVRRVLRPGGWLGLVWNKVTPVEKWEFELAGIDPDLKGTKDEQPLVLPFPQRETQVASFPWTWQMTPERFRAYLSTNSAVIRMESPERELKLDMAEATVGVACRDIGTESVPMHHEAFCVRWQPS